MLYKQDFSFKSGRLFYIFVQSFVCPFRPVHTMDRKKTTCVQHLYWVVFYICTTIFNNEMWRRVPISTTDWVLSQCSVCVFVHCSGGHWWSWTDRDSDGQTDTRCLKMLPYILFVCHICMQVNSGMNVWIAAQCIICVSRRMDDCACVPHYESTTATAVPLLTQMPC